MTHLSNISCRFKRVIMWSLLHYTKTILTMKSDQVWKYLSTVNIVLLYRHKTRISYLFKNLQHDVGVVSCSAVQKAFIPHSPLRSLVVCQIQTFCKRMKFSWKPLHKPEDGGTASFLLWGTGIDGDLELLLPTVNGTHDMYLACLITQRGFLAWWQLCTLWWQISSWGF